MPASNLHFLVVDDDDLLRFMMKRMLHSFSAAEVLEASNDTKALEILHDPHKNPIDIILCDLNMPEMDGMEFLRHLGEISSDISVIVISGHDDTLIAAVRKMALAYGIRLLGSTQKPITRAHFEDFILQHNAAQQPKKKAYAAAAQNFTL